MCFFSQVYKKAQKKNAMSHIFPQQLSVNYSLLISKISIIGNDFCGFVI